MVLTSRPEGSLAGRDVADIVQQLRADRWTGTLILSHMGAARTIALSEGAMVSAGSTHRDDRLGEALLRRGRITLKDYQQATEAVRGGRRFGQALVDAGVLTGPELDHLVEEIAADIVYRALQATEGDYRLQAGAPAGSMWGTLRRTTPDLILEAIRRVDSWTRVETALGGPGARYARANAYEDLIPEMTLSFERLSVLTDLHGVRTVAEVCAESSLTDFEVCQLLWALRVIGGVQRMDVPVTAVTEMDDEGLDEVLEAAGQPEPPTPPAPAIALPRLPSRPVAAAAAPLPPRAHAPGPMPVAAPPASRTLEESEDMPSVIGGKRVLLVGLSRDLSFRMEPILSRAQLAVVQVPDGSSAGALCASSPFDLLLVMDPLSGATLPELIQAARERHPGAEVMVAAEPSRIASVMHGAPAGTQVIASDPIKLLDAMAVRLLGVAPRLAARMLVRMEVKLTEGKRLLMFQTENISDAGMLVRADRVLPVGTTVGLEFTPPGARAPVVIQAEVVRHSDPDVEGVQGMGMRFISFKADSLKRLQEYLGQLAQAG